MIDVFTLQESENILFIKSVLQKHIVELNIINISVPKDDIIIAGGYFATMLDVGNQRYNDIDVFILNNNRSVYDRLTYTNQPDPNGHVWSVSSPGRYMNKNPHVLGVSTNKTTKVQYILTDHKTRKELLADFDFVHCTVSYYALTQSLYITRQAYDCIMKKELRDNKKEHPAQWRKDKFNKLGWHYHIDMSKPLPALVENLQISKSAALQQAFNKVPWNVPTGSFTIEKDDLEAVRKLLT